MKDASFNAGRDLAVEFIQHAQDSMDRFGNFDEHPLHTAAGMFRPVFERLRERPELVDGFDAVLGEFLAITSYGVANLEVLERMTRDEYSRSLDVVRNLA